jgi:YD repeat-containing protein
MNLSDSINFIKNKFTLFGLGISEFGRSKTVRSIVLPIAVSMGTVPMHQLSADTSASVVEVTQMTDSSASLDFDLEKDASEVMLVWGSKDAGANVDSWENKAAFTDLQAGGYRYEIDDLKGNSVYYYNIAVGSSVAGYEIQGASSNFTKGMSNESHESVWFDDEFPDNEYAGSSGGSFDWSETLNPTPRSGSKALQMGGAGVTQHFFMRAEQNQSLILNEGDSLYAHVYLDADNPPERILFQLMADESSFLVYWDSERINNEIVRETNRLKIGPLPSPGQWVKLQVSASEIGLAGKTINGMSFTLYDGKATFDSVGKDAWYLSAEEDLKTKDRTRQKDSKRLRETSESQLEVLYLASVAAQESLANLDNKRYETEYFEPTRTSVVSSSSEPFDLFALLRGDLSVKGQNSTVTYNTGQVSFENHGAISLLDFDLRSLLGDESNEIRKATLKLTTIAHDSETAQNILDLQRDTTIGVKQIVNPNPQPIDLTFLDLISIYDKRVPAIGFAGLIRTNFTGDLGSSEVNYRSATASSPQTPELSFDVTSAVNQVLNSRDVVDPVHRGKLYLSLFSDPSNTSIVQFNGRGSESGKGPQLIIETAATGSAPDPINGDSRVLKEIVMEVQEPADYQPFGAVSASSSVDEQGNFIYSLPIDLPAGVNGMTPSVSLSYNSGNKFEATLGRGWSLNHGQVRIERRRLNLIDDGEYTLDKYDETKHGYHLNGQPLRRVDSLGDKSFYATDEDVHARISRWGSLNGSETDLLNFATNGATLQYTNDFWRIQTKNGIKQTLKYRTVGESEQLPIRKAEGWNLSKEEDQSGNAITYEYNTSYNYIDTIEYAYTNDSPNVSVDFSYIEKYQGRGSRPDRVVYRDGEAYHVDKHKLDEITITVGGSVYRTYKVKYLTEDPADIKLISSIEIYKGTPESGILLDRHSFQYHGGDEGFEYTSSAADSFAQTITAPIFGTSRDSTGNFSEASFDTGVRMFDYNNDGLIDILVARDMKRTTIGQLNPLSDNDTPKYYSGKTLYRNTGSGFVDSTVEDAHCIPPVPFQECLYSRTEADGGKYIFTMKDSKEHSRLIDINGDGLDDIIRWNGNVYINQGYNPNSDSALWQKDSAYKYAIPDNVINAGLFNGTFLILDFNGDGLVDIYEEKDLINFSSKFIKSLHVNTGTGWRKVYGLDYNASWGFGSVGDPNLKYYNDNSDIESLMPGGLISRGSEFNRNTLCDVNGDGLIDFLYFGADSGADIYLNNGSSFEKWEGVRIPDGVNFYNNNAEGGINKFSVQSRFIDLNDDGLLDLVYKDESVSNVSRKVYLNTGKGFVENDDFDPGLEFYDSDKTFDLGVNSVDFNVDGFTDLIQSYHEVVGKVFLSSESEDRSIILNGGYSFLPSDNSHASEYLDDRIGLINYDRVPTYFEMLLKSFDSIALDLGFVIGSGGSDLISDVFLVSDFFIFSRENFGNSAGQGFFDINGDGSKDMVYVPGFYIVNEASVDPLFRSEFFTTALEGSSDNVIVGLNKRSGDFMKMVSASNNLSSLSVTYSSLAKARGSYVSATTAKIPGDVTESIIDKMVPMQTVESISYDLAGHEHTVDYFYGELTFMPGEGFSFGRTWKVDPTMRTVDVVSRHNSESNKGIFGRPSDSKTYHFGYRRFGFDRNNDFDRSVLFNPSLGTGSGNGLHLMSASDYTYNIWFSYSDGYFENDTHAPVVPTPGAVMEHDNEPFFLTTDASHETYDPIRANTLRSRTSTSVLPNRFGSTYSRDKSVYGMELNDDLSDKETTTALSLTDVDVRSTVSVNNSFFTNSDQWPFDRLRTQDTVAMTGKGTRTVTKELTYDSVDVWRVKSLKEGFGELYKIKDFEYDDFGNLSKVTSYADGASESEKRSVTTSYVTEGALSGRALSSITRNDWTTTYSDHDEFTGSPGSVTDPNGLVTTFEYDAYNRVKKTVDPTGREMLISVEEAESVNSPAAYIVRQASSGPHYVYTAYDNVGRALKRWAPGFDWNGLSALADSTWNQVVTEYGDDGSIKAVSRPRPYFEGISAIRDGAVESKYYYDNFGRIHRVYGRDGSLTASYSYQPANYENVTVTDAVGTQTTTRNYGSSGVRTMSPGGKSGVFQGFEVIPTGSISYIRTDADADGILEKDTMIKRTYDIFGRLVELEDPSFGTQTFTYNGFDEPVVIRKNPGTDDETTISFIRDNFGRARIITYNGKRNGISEKTRTEKYLFDDDGNRFPGKKIFYGFLFQKESVVPGKSKILETYESDEFGRISTVNTSITEFLKRSRGGRGGTSITHNFDSNRVYDNLGRLSVYTYPFEENDTGYSVNYAYKENGQLWQIYDEDDSSRVIWAATDLDEEGFVRSEQLGSSTILVHEKSPLGQLGKSRAYKTGSPSNLMLSTYNYYRDGTMRARSLKTALDGGLTTSEEFEYDRLKQLTDVTHMVSDAPESDTYTETSLRFEYDDHSRMTRKDYIDVEGAEMMEFIYPVMDAN